MRTEELQSKDKGSIPKRRKRTMQYKGLNQLLCAAVINNTFRESLLRNPAQALAKGYLGQSFALSAEERDLVIKIQAQKLEDFAAQVHQLITGDDNGHRQSVKAYSAIVRKGNGHRDELLDGGEPSVELVGVAVPA
jgi:hypothetical protein